jgi:enamine deaminase RidA (YjgF/YER057c/UK114 family)
MGRVRARLEAAGFRLPPPFGPAGTYVSSVETPGHVFVAGVGPTEGRSLVWTGRVGDTLTVDQGRQAAQLTALNALAILDTAVGLDRVRACVRMFGLVCSTPDFTEHMEVLAGADEVIAAAFGPQARPVWAAVGSPCLPVRIAVEIEALFAVTSLPA